MIYRNAILFFFLLLSCNKHVEITKPIEGRWEMLESYYSIKGLFEDPVVFELGGEIYLGFGTIDENYLGEGEINKKPNTSFYKFDMWIGWKKTEEIPVFPGEYREGAVTVAIDDNLYIGLGRTYDSLSHNYINHKDFWNYNAVTHEWSMLPFEFPGAPRMEAIGFSINNKAYIGAGASRETDFYELDPTTGWRRIGDISESRFRATSFVVSNTAYIGCGEKIVDDDTPPYLMKLIQPNMEWQNIDYSTHTDIKALEHSEATTFTIRYDQNEYVYLIGGKCINSLKNDIWRYDVKQNTWTNEGEFPSPLNSKIGFTKENRAFIVTLGPYCLDTWEYIIQK